MWYRGLTIICCLAAGVISSAAQAGRRLDGPHGGAVLVNVAARRVDSKSDPITTDKFSFFDAGIQQTVRTFTPDPGPANIVLLVDNSATVRADAEQLMQAAREFAYEIYEGDRLMVVRYANDAEIVGEWTDSAKTVETAVKTFQKSGDPHLFDALHAVLTDALEPLAAETKKRVVIILGDGLDRGSKTKFENILAEMQDADITLYALQLPDRTGGAYRRDRPKPPQVLEKLTVGTGGAIFPLAKATDAAKSICDELRNNRYLLSYQPSSVPYGETRSLLVAADDGILMRSKTSQPPH